MAGMYGVLKNETLLTLLKTESSGEGESFPVTIGPGGKTEWWTTDHGQGSATYTNLQNAGSVHVSWKGASPSAKSTYPFDHRIEGGSDFICTVRTMPAPQVRPAIPVAPNGQSVVDTEDLLALRDKVVASAKAEAAEWVKAASAPDPEAERVKLRQKYVDATIGYNVPELKKQLGQHTSVNFHWCGVFATWNVREVRKDVTVGPMDRRDVVWKSGERPQNVLRCNDMAKIHKGDVAHKKNDADVQAKYYAWLQQVKSHEAAVKAEHPDWKGDAVNAEARKRAGPPPKAPPEHHVLITRSEGDVLEIVEGNSGTVYGAPYEAFSLVTSSTIARGDIDVFYCTIPAAQCWIDAVARNTGPQAKHLPLVCPVANGQPCRLPDPKGPPRQP